MFKYSLLLLLLFTLFSNCIGDQWLMEGDFISESEATRRGLILVSANSTTSVTSSLTLSLTAASGHRINCVLAASLHMNGHVSLIKDGVGTNSVTLNYETINGRPDQLFIQIETHAVAPELPSSSSLTPSEEASVRIIGPDLAVGPRVSIHYDKLREWINNEDQIVNDTIT